MLRSAFKTLELFITGSTSISIQFQLSPHILDVDLLRQHCGRFSFPFRTFYKGIGFTDIGYTVTVREFTTFKGVGKTYCFIFNYRTFKKLSFKYIIYYSEKILLAN